MLLRLGTSSSNVSAMGGMVTFVVKWKLGACIFLMHDICGRELGAHVKLIYGGGTFVEARCDV